MRLHLDSSEAPVGPTIHHWERLFVLAVAGLLATTATLKLHAGWSAPWSIVGREKVFDLDLRSWSVGAAILEYVAAVLMTFAPTRGLALRVIRGAFGAILIYRFFLIWQGAAYCGCLGRLLANSPWQAQEGLVLGSLAIAVFALNETFLFWRRRLERRWSGFPGTRQLEE